MTRPSRELFLSFEGTEGTGKTTQMRILVERLRVTLPAGYNGELDATTGNGDVRSDFDLKIEGRMNPRHIRATIGTGGPRLRLTTGNGGLEVRKGS
jgi:hypothetical protein